MANNKVWPHADLLAMLQQDCGIMIQTVLNYRNKFKTLKNILGTKQYREKLRYLSYAVSDIRRATPIKDDFAIITVRQVSPIRTCVKTRSNTHKGNIHVQEHNYVASRYLIKPYYDHYSKLYHKLSQF
jgi:hypothetical protein